MLSFLRNACVAAVGVLLLLHAFGYIQAFEAPMMMVLGLLVLGAGVLGMMHHRENEKHRK